MPGGRQPDQGGRGPGSPTEPVDPPIVLGDVVVCPTVAARQAPAHAGTVDDELALLVVHGVLHLLNYDHADEREARVDATPGTGAAGALPAAREAEGRVEHVSGADWAILVVVVVLFVAVDLARAWPRPRSCA